MFLVNFYPVWPDRVIWPGSANDFGRTLGGCGSTMTFGLPFGNQTWPEFRLIFRVNLMDSESAKRKTIDTTKKDNRAYPGFPFVSCSSIRPWFHVFPTIWPHVKVWIPTYEPIGHPAIAHLDPFWESQENHYVGFHRILKNIRTFRKNYHRTFEYSKSSQELCL